MTVETTVTCDRCGKNWGNYGAGKMVFTATLIATYKDKKFHLCKRCTRKLHEWLGLRLRWEKRT